MKKWLIAICISLVLLFLAGIYYFIPPKLHISVNIVAGSNQQGLFRFLSNSSNWKDWWPENQPAMQTDPLFRFNSYAFKLTDVSYNALKVTIFSNQNTDTSIILMMPIGNDSTSLVWDAVVNTGSNPITKISGYRKAKKIQAALSGILDTLQSFSATSKGIYGIDVKKEPVQLEYVVSTKKIFPQYPDTEGIYAMINSLRSYVGQTSAKEEDYPMVNISSLEEGEYLAQVGLPINKDIPETNDFFLKRLLKNGNILVAETRGGRNACDSAMKAMALYANDHKNFSIALPFLSLITDRTKEKDSTKWVTKIYYPVN